MRECIRFDITESKYFDTTGLERLKKKTEIIPSPLVQSTHRDVEPTSNDSIRSSSSSRSTRISVAEFWEAELQNAEMLPDYKKLSIAGQYRETDVEDVGDYLSLAHNPVSKLLNKLVGGYVYYLGHKWALFNRSSSSLLPVKMEIHL